MSMMRSFPKVVVETVDTDEAEDYDQGEEKAIRNLQDLNPHADEGEIENKQHDVADVHAGDDTPKKIGMLGDEKGTRLDSVDDESTKKHCHDRMRWNTESK